VLAAQERAVEIDGHHLSPRVEFGLLDIAQRRYPRRIDEAVEPAMRAADLGDHAQPIEFFGDVQRMRCAKAYEVAGDGAAVLGHDRIDDRLADRASRPGDQDDLVLEPGHAASAFVIVGVAVRMVVAAVLVMHVMMIVAMTVAMAMRMILVMRVVVAMIAGSSFVGSTLRLERRVDRRDLRAEALQQCLDGGIALEPQPALQHLDRHVPVAKVPGQPRQPRQIGGARLDQRLGLGHDLNQPAGVELQRVVGAKPHRLGKVQFDASAFHAEQEALLRLALRVGQDQRVDRGGVPPFGGAKNADGAGHGGDPIGRRGMRVV
jgi:hypothetical protein